MACDVGHSHSPLTSPQAALPRRPLRVLLGAFGDPGHAFPMIALGRSLAARGHDVTLQTWERWRSPVEAEGMTFTPAPEYSAFPVPLPGQDGVPQPLDFYEAVVYTTRDTLPLVRELRPDVVVHDILTLGPALAGELAGIPRATLIPHVHPEAGQGFPIYSFGALLPRTRLGRALWHRAHLPVRRGLENGRLALNRTRAQLGLPPLAHTHGGTSRELALVATFPQLEYPRAWPSHVHVVGPLLWEPPAEDIPLPPGDAPLVLIAPSTSQDPDHRLLHAALRGLADAPLRVLATYNRRLPSRPLPVPANARVCRLALLRSHPAPLRRRRLPRRPRHARARALLRRSGRRLPRRRRHERERRPPGLGRRRRASAAPLHLTAPTSPGCRAGARRAFDPGAGPGVWRVGVHASTRALVRRALIEHLVESGSSGGGTRTHNLSLNRRALCQLSYPGSCYPGRGREPSDILRSHLCRRRDFPLHLGVAVGAQKYALAGLNSQPLD